MKRDGFATKLGILAAAAGSAVGLGNIWKFPYITGKNGGAAFILVYLLCISLIGLPVMLTEFLLGRNSQSNVVRSFKKLAPGKKWYLTGVLSTATSFIILSYYLVIAGWVLSYMFKAATGTLSRVAPDKLADYFGSVASATYQPLFWNFVVVALTAFIVLSGVKDGIEKYSKVLMPALFVILVVLMIRSLTLDGAYAGVEFLFKPDFSQLKASSVLEALGHCFYSLSLGMGIAMTFGSYIDKKENLFNIAFKVTVADTLVALMAGLVIFPAVFAYGFKPTAGPSLIFITLPAVFRSMPFGSVFETLFFLLIAIAAITSTISLLEVSVSVVVEELKMDRKKATILLSVVLFLLSIPSSLSFGAMSKFTILGKTFFDFLDYLTSNIFLPLGGLLVCLFAAWVFGVKKAVKEIESDGLYSLKSSNIYNSVVKYLAPVAILVIFLNSTGLLNVFKSYFAFLK